MKKSKRILSVALALIIALGVMTVGAASFSVAALGKTSLNSVAYNSNASVTLGWSAASGANKYQIAKLKKGDKSYSYLYSDKTSYNDKSIVSGTIYYYQIRPMYVSGKKTTYGAWSNTKSITTLYRPTITAMLFSSDCLTINWNQIKGATKYKLAFRRTTDTLWNYREVTSTYYPIFNRTKNAKYVAQVCPMNGSIAGQWSAGKVADPNYLAKPVIDSVGQLAWWEDILLISWSISTPAESFTLYYKKAEDSGWSTISTSFLSATLGDFDKNAVYYFQVQAHGQNGNSSPYSSVKMFTLG